MIKSAKEYKLVFPHKELVPDYLIEIMIRCGINIGGEPVCLETFKREYRKYHKIYTSQNEEIKNCIKTQKEK